MRDCPKCNAVVDGEVCPSCGYGSSPKSQVLKDPDWWRCCDVDTASNRCASAGTLTESVRGSDRWYCHAHFPPFRRRYGQMTPMPQTVRALLPKKFDPEAVLERLALQSQ